jgi:hypothetical protein
LDKIPDNKTEIMQDFFYSEKIDFSDYKDYPEDTHDLIRQFLNKANELKKVGFEFEKFDSIAGSVFGLINFILTDGNKTESQ